MSNLVYFFLNRTFLPGDYKNMYTADTLPLYYQQTYNNNKKYADNSYFITQSPCNLDGFVDVNSLINTEKYKEVIDIFQTKWSRYMVDPFWFNTTIRVFLFLIFIIENNLTDTVHVEGDNLIYYNIENLNKMFVNNEYGFCNEAPFAAAPCFIFVKDKKAAQTLLELHIKLIKKGEDSLKYHVGHFYNWITDMALLDLIYKYNKDYKMLPCLPYGEYSQNFETIKMLFDPNPYGMFLGGTNQGHPAGYTEYRHFIGKEIMEKNIDVIYEKKPFVLYEEQKIPIFNLHLHNKKCIEKFL